MKFYLLLLFESQVNDNFELYICYKNNINT